MLRNLLSENESQKALQSLGELVSSAAAPIKPYNPAKFQQRGKVPQETASDGKAVQTEKKAHKKARLKGKEKGKADTDATRQDPKQQKHALTAEQREAVKKERAKRKERKEANKRRRAKKRKAAARERPSWLRKWIAAGTNEVTRALEHNKLACLFICKDSTQVSDEAKDKNIIVQHLPSLAAATGTPFCSINLTKEQLFLLFGLHSLRAFGFYKTVDGEQKENAEKVAKVVATVCSLLDSKKSSTRPQSVGDEPKRKRDQHEGQTEEGESNVSKKMKPSQ